MSETFENFLNEKIKISKKTSVLCVDIIFFLLITFCAIIVRILQFSFVSGDYSQFLSKWYDTLKAAGGLQAIGLSLGDYTPPYIYIIALLTYLPINSLTAIKLVSCIFDFIAAIYVMKIVYLKYQKHSLSILSYSLTLFAPTVWLNSAAWAQCDIIFTTFLIICVYYFMKEKPLKATAFFAIAFTFKLQAIFLAPFLIYMWSKNKMKFKHFFIIPIVYLISIIPAFIMGRPFKELLTIYFNQSAQYKKMSLNAPNLYLWLENKHSDLFGRVAVILCFIAILAWLYFFYIKKFDITNENILAVAFLFSLLVPFLLPHMHERYFFTADVLSIIFVFFYPKKYYISFMVIMSSLLAYLPFLFGVEPIKLTYVAIIMLFALFILSKHIIKEIL